jgi:hypothetical protein
VSSAILSAAEAEAPRDKPHPESGAGWIPSLTRFLIFDAVIARAWYGWKEYGREISDLVAILIDSGPISGGRRRLDVG